MAVCGAALAWRSGCCSGRLKLRSARRRRLAARMEAGGRLPGLESRHRMHSWEIVGLTPPPVNPRNVTAQHAVATSAATGNLPVVILSRGSVLVVVAARWVLELPRAQ